MRKFAAALAVTSSLVAQCFVVAQISSTTVVSGLSTPIAFTQEPGTGRVFITEAPGRVKIYDPSLGTTITALTLPAGQVSSTDERGVIGVCFDPAYAINGFLYLHYTHAATVRNRVARFVVSGSTISATSETLILEMDPRVATRHNGGAMHFRPDGKLYVAVGDNQRGTAGAQLLTNLFGKLLRINSDGSIPNDNPFYATTTGNNRAIFSNGLRNPFIFSLNSAGSRVFVNDVGENTW